jgi:hypothetical protein
MDLQTESNPRRWIVTKVKKKTALRAGSADRLCLVHARGKKSN